MTVELEQVTLNLTCESCVARVGPFDAGRGTIEIFLDGTFLSCLIHGDVHDQVEFGAVIYLRFRLGEGKVAQKCTRRGCAGREVVLDLDEGVVARARAALGPRLAWDEVRDTGLAAEDPDAAGPRPHEWTAEEDVIIWAGRAAKPAKKYEDIARMIAEARAASGDQTPSPVTRAMAVTREQVLAIGARGESELGGRLPTRG